MVRRPALGQRPAKQQTEAGQDSRLEPELAAEAMRLGLGLGKSTGELAGRRFFRHVRPPSCNVIAGFSLSRESQNSADSHSTIRTRNLQGFGKGFQKNLLLQMEKAPVSRRTARLLQPATRQMLLDVGSERLGEPGEEVERAIGRIADLERLRRLGRRLLHVATWQELLDAT
jgi:hypothetical protein